MKRMKNIIAIGVTGLILLAVSSLHAAGTSGAQFLKMGAGARASALGNAYSSIADDATAAYWNPAGLAQVKNAEISLMHNTWIEDTNYQYAGIVKPVERNSFAVSIYRLDFGDIEGYSDTNVKTSNFDAGSLAAAFSWGREVNENLYMGVTAKYIKENIENENATGFAGDFGVLYKRNGWNYSAVLQHIGSSMKMVQDSYKLPQTVRAGLSRTFKDDKVLMAFDISKPNDNDASFHLGSEYKLSSIVALRAGYATTPGNNLDVDGLTGITGGLGVQLERVGFDYSITPFGDLGLTHRVSLRFSFLSAPRY